MNERSEMNVGLTDMLDGAAPRYTLPELIAELRRQGAKKNRTWPCVLLKDLLPLCDAYEQMEANTKEAVQVRDRMADLLSRTAVALRGPEPPLTRWSWHDLPERAAAAIAAVDVMQRAAAINHAPPNA